MLDTDRTGDRFDTARKDELIDSGGIRYRDFRRALTPRYLVVWLDLLSGHAALVLIAYAVVLVGLHQPAFRLPLVALGAIAFGYAIAYILLFFHEAAHYNLTGSRRANDALANLMIGWLVGQDIAAYRQIHFDHHRHLGTPLDTEPTYFDALDTRFVVESLLGIKALRVLARRETTLRGASPDQDNTRMARRAQLALGLVLHAAVAVEAWWLGWWYLAAAWVLGVALVGPFFFALRQVLEHRDEAADRRVDYRRQSHGPVNRVFGDGPIASTLGGAGFNRHLLHHWEPQVSYTRLPEIERFLLDTELADALRDRTTTYLRTFRRLFAA